MTKSLSNAKTIIYRIDKNGFREEIVFTGNIRQKPKGWKIGNRIA